MIFAQGKKQLKQFVSLAKEITENEPDVYEVEDNSFYRDSVKSYCVQIHGLSDEEFHEIALKRGLI